eukprot:NODE_819_length_3714_cov_0.260304.p1 type:complete len:457 gc:universal NODE_819_length_3714_cov_0.260304:3450-2080(-)
MALFLRLCHPQLSELDLRQNLLSGMPKSFPSHTVKIYLSQNMLTSMPQLPPTLQTFDISYNVIFDKLPNIFPKTLTSFVASHNLIYGDISNISSTLNLLSLDNNQLNGTLKYLPNSLSYLKLEFNQLKGSLPTQLPPLLSSFQLSYNMLSGSISNFTSLTNLKDIVLSWNLFTGNLPVLSSISYYTVDFSYNLLSGNIDMSYSKVMYLHLSFNQFKKLPISLPQSITAFGLAGNSLSGNITSGLFSTLSWLDLSCNSLMGNIPSISPEFLNMSHNLFTGSIPISLQNVGYLDLSYNQLSGCINFQFTGYSFDLNNNFLSGAFSFASPSQLHMQNNQITDVSMVDPTNLISCDVSNNPMAPGVFGKTFYNYCNLDDVYSSNNTTCGIVPLDVNHTYYIPSKTFNPTTTKLQKTDSKWTTLKNTTELETREDTQTVALQVDVTLVTRISNLFRPYAYE